MNLFVVQTAQGHSLNWKYALHSISSTEVKVYFHNTPGRIRIISTNLDSTHESAIGPARVLMSRDAKGTIITFDPMT